MILDATTAEDPAIMPKNANCPLSPKSAIFARACPTWWPTVHSKRSSSSLHLLALREQQPHRGMRKRSKATQPFLKSQSERFRETVRFFTGTLFIDSDLRFYLLSDKKSHYCDIYVMCCSIARGQTCPL